MNVTRSIKLIGLIFGLATLWPVSVYAAVIINEVAWMGNENSANDEWIELYNDGADMDLTGWVLKDGKSVEINLTGTISSGNYVVLERTDDSSAPSKAFLVYTGALSNTGGTLTLYDDSGVIVDQVAGGKDWENIGGDNVTKETAQLTPAGWVTAEPTPGAINKQTGSIPADTYEVEDVPVDTDSDSSTETVYESSNGVSQDSESVLYLPEELKVVVTVPTRLYQNQNAVFSTESSGLRGGMLRALHYEWNFGDGMMSTTESPKHRYQYPGNYVVTLLVYRGEHEVEYRQTVTVLPATLSVTQLNNGDIQLHNDAKYEIDVSGYRVGGLEGVVMPPRTIMLPNSTITLAANRFKDQSLAMVFDSVGKVVYGAEVVPGHYAYSHNDSTAVPLIAGAASSTEVTMERMDMEPVPTTISRDITKSSNNPEWPWYALFGLLAVATLGIYTRYI